MPNGTEFGAALGVAIVALASRIFNLAHVTFNSDESQHLHVIWAWARGFVQYRDVFDNHMPLFQIMFAPVFALIGDRATILVWMRCFMLPLYFLTAWCTYRIGALLFSRRAGVWALLLTGIYPTYHLASLEFRTDNLWAAFWLLCILVLVERPITVRSSLVAGFLLGFAFAVSAKTTLLFLSILFGAVTAFFLVKPAKLNLSQRQLAFHATSFVTGAVLVPAIIAGWFALAGVWNDFRYCVFEHNIVSHFRNRPAWFVLFFPLLLPLVIWIARNVVKSTPDPLLAFRRALAFATCGFYVTSLEAFWSLVTKQDFLPSQPIAAVFCAAALLAIAPFIAQTSFRFENLLRPISLFALAAAIELAVLFILRPPWTNGAKKEIDLLRGVLELTEPGDFVFDTKGEMIFRQRCFRPVFEGLTCERMRRGLVIDSAPERCVATRTCVVIPPKELWLPSHHFIEENYLPVRDGLWVVGNFLTQRFQNNFAFDVVIPGEYKIIDSKGAASGSLDGSRYEQARFLSAGRHVFESRSSAQKLAFVWARAVDRNFVPAFH